MSLLNGSQLIKEDLLRNSDDEDPNAVQVWQSQVASQPRGSGVVQTRAVEVRSFAVASQRLVFQEEVQDDLFAT